MVWLRVIGVLAAGILLHNFSLYISSEEPVVSNKSAEEPPVIKKPAEKPVAIKKPVSAFNYLKFKPDLVTKESILANYQNLTKDPIFKKKPQLAIIHPTHKYERDLVIERADRLQYVTYTVLNVIPDYTNNKITGVQIRGGDLIDHDHIRKLRKVNPDIKIVPRFEFAEFPLDKCHAFAVDSVLIQRVAKQIVDYCREHGFDGALIDSYEQFSDSIYKNDISVLQMWEQIGKVIRKHKLTAILSIMAPFEFIYEKGYKDPTIGQHLPEVQMPAVARAYDLTIIWPRSTKTRRNANDLIYKRNFQFFGGNANLLAGIPFFGYECSLKKQRNGQCELKECYFDRFMDVLKRNSSELIFNEQNMEHELISEEDDIYIVFPSLTQLEHLIYSIQEFRSVGVAFFDYGGLDYLTNIV